MEESKKSCFISDRVDYKGDPADRNTTGGWVPAALIVGIEVSERLSTMGIIVNLVTYLKGTMHQSSTTSSNSTSNVAGTSFLLCLLGGILADSFLGRYWTIAIFSVIHALGTCMLAISAALPELRPSECNLHHDFPLKCEEPSSFQMGILYTALYSMALGVGGIKSSVSGFGTEQFDQNDEKEMSEMAHFFNRFYLIISFGTLLAVTVLVYVQDQVGRSWGYGICSASMFLSIVAFLVGTKRYRYRECTGSPIIQILQVIVAAIRKRKAELPTDLSFLYDKASDKESTISHTDKYSCLDKGAIITGMDRGADGLTISNPWGLCTVTEVEEVKMLIRILPIMASTIIFWTIRAQLLSFSVQQAATMERTIENFPIPPASFNGFFVGSTIITLIMYDRLLPFLRQSSNGVQGFTNLQKIGIAIFLSILGMAAASFAEMKRLEVVRANRGSTSTSSTLPITAFYLLPQFVLVGIGDGFMYTGQLDFFITESPKGMKAISTGLFLTTNALGFFGSSILVTIITKVTGEEVGHGWLLSRINDSRLDFFYALLAVLGFINLVFYLVLASWYKPSPVEDAHQKINGKEEKV
uniref:Dicarboxylate transporter n=1 Tax=Alnus glutinosa TaxID=3517 RepID=Q7Y0R5_ALNGL|nr:dicarboxylate transporter [Alnus glutinosa]